MYVLQALPETPQIKNIKWNNQTVKIVGHTLYLEIGAYSPPKRGQKRNYRLINPNKINVQGVRRELLEYHYGIYRMFPTGKQYQYHMQYLHVAGVTERSIR